MEAGSASRVGRSQNMFPCVIGVQYPEFCKESFPTIKKHNEHIQRCHSPEFWCEVCLHKFDGSLQMEPLRLAKREHEKICPGESLGENSELRFKEFIMSQEQLERFMDGRWKKVRVPQLTFGHGQKEDSPQTSWRQIHEAIFPIRDVKVVSSEIFEASQESRLASNGFSFNAFDLPQPVPLQSDSGYQSMKRDTKEGLLPGLPEERLLQANVQEAEQYTTDSLEDHDTMTGFSGAWIMPAVDLDEWKANDWKAYYWKAELSGQLYHDISQMYPAFGSSGRLNIAIPPLIRSFALRLGSVDSSDAGREVVLFVYRHVEEISTAFKKLVENSPKFPDKSSGIPEDAISKWRANFESREIPEVLQPDVVNLDYAEERPLAIEIENHLAFVFNSVAYRWLVAGLVQQFELKVVDADLDLHSRVHLHQIVYNRFELSRPISRKQPSEQYQMKFITNWNPTKFLKQQFGSQCDIGRLLGEALTLTGNATDAQMLPCSEYLRQTWPTTGPRFLELLRKALVSDGIASGELEDNTTLRCKFEGSRLTVQVQGITDSIVTIGEQIGWLGAALRPSLSESEFASCRPMFGYCGLESEFASCRPMFGNFGLGTDRTLCHIKFQITPMVLTEDTSGQCWHAILRNPVIVKGYPIPRRKRYGTGLSMPLNVMAGLTSSPRIHKHGGHYYLKCYSTALVPTEKIDNMVLWHLYYSEDGSRLPYPNSNDIHHVDLSIQDLTAARHVVGWCSNAKFLTGGADMNYAIGASLLQRPGKEFTLEKVSFSFGQFVTGGCQFAIGRKDCHVRITQGTYIKKLQWLDKKYVTLWDVEDERGWLVNGNAALLHLLRSSLQHSSTDKFRSQFHFKAEEFEESDNPYSLDSALDVLLNKTNQQLELYDKDTDIQQGHGTTSRTTIKDRVKELYEILEKLFNYTATLESLSKGLNIKSYF